MKFIVWHYLLGWEWFWKRAIFNFRKLFHFFSLGILIRTLFSPWKRLTVKESSSGFDIAKFFENLSFNIISSGIGFVVRVVLIFFTLVLGLSYLLILGPYFVIWWIFPIFGWSYYKQDKKRAGFLLKEIERKIRNKPKNSNKIIFESEGGKFIKSRLEENVDDILASIEVNEESLKDLEGDSLEKIVAWFLNQDKQKEREFQKLEMTGQDIVLAAKWWDRKQLLWREVEDEKWSLGRPGIGWDLLFGYTPNLDKYSSNLGRKQDFSDHLIGREAVVKKIEKIMNGNNNVLLVGNPGVGKMTVVYEFAERAITGELGRKLAYKKLISLDYQRAMAGSEDGDFKKKILSDLMREAEAAGNIVLVVKDLFRITSADFAGKDYVDVFDSVLERNKLKMIALVGRNEYERFLAKDQRVSKNFEVVEVLPPSKEEALLILMRASIKVERTMKVRFSIQALREILEGSDKYITETPFPEKALELMDGVAINKKEGQTSIGRNEVIETLSEKTGISLNRLNEGEREKLTNLEEIISKKLIGQKAAVDLIAKSLRSRVAAVKSDERPVGSFLFLGPTGVGKTETAKVLADVYFGSQKSILRFDMAEYVGKEGLSRLIGSVGNNQPGAMTTAIRNRPASLLLLDEIEKAPKEVYNLFLTMLDEGYINDAKGKKVDCRHLFIVATSNAGSKFIREEVMAGVDGEELQKKVVDYVQKEGFYSPEFLNRFDGVVVFEPLSEESLVKIGKLMLGDFKNNLLGKNINIDFGEGVAEKIAKDGYNVEFGARPMRRIVDLILGDCIGKAIISQEVLAGDKIRLVAGEEKDEYKIEKIV
jgi:ATP-dependent Clp protease ATP-binding subunit ClpC